MDGIGWGLIFALSLLLFCDFGAWSMPGLFVCLFIFFDMCILSCMGVSGQDFLFSIFYFLFPIFHIVYSLLPLTSNYVVALSGAYTYQVSY